MSDVKYVSLGELQPRGPQNKVIGQPVEKTDYASLADTLQLLDENGHP